MIAKTRFLKGRKEMAEGDEIRVLVLPDVPDLGPVTFYYFKKIQLTPAAYFPHLSGIGLSAFLDHATLELCLPGVGDHESHANIEKVKDARYVHGRSEVARGMKTLTAIVMAKTDVPLDDPSWFVKAPALYQLFLQNLPPEG